MQLSKQIVIPSSVGFVSFALGMGGGYLLKSYLDKKKPREITDELEEKVVDLGEEVVQLHFQFLEAKEEMNSAAGTVTSVLLELKNEGQRLLDKVAADMHRSMQDHPTNNAGNNGSDDVGTVNIFPDREDHWDYDEEEKHRTEERPHILHVDEYFANEKQYTQITLMYYQGDNILCDDKDVPIYNPESMVGKLDFGHGSNDPNIVYIRNDKLQVEFEVLLDHGHFQIEVLGAHVEDDYEEGDVKHSLHKFREV